MHKLVIAPSAADDLDAIVDYICHRLFNPEAANALLDEIESVYDTLENYPESFAFCDDGVLKAAGYHQVPVKRYIMIYRVVDSVVRIVHFYHATQDYINKMLQSRTVFKVES